LFCILKCSSPDRDVSSLWRNEHQRYISMIGIDCDERQHSRIIDDNLSNFNGIIVFTKPVRDSRALLFVPDRVCVVFMMYMTY